MNAEPEDDPFPFAADSLIDNDVKGRMFPLYFEIALIGVVVAVLIFTGYIVTAIGSDTNWQW